MNRRHFLKASAALAGGLAACPIFTASASAGNTGRKLVISTRTLDINGKAATVYGLTDAVGRHGLTFDPGERFQVSLHNDLKEPTIIHWHGLTPPFDQDGVADNPLPMLGASEQRLYDFALERPGSNWMHAHTLQHQNLLSAPLIIRSPEDVAADIQDVTVMLHDFSFTPAVRLLEKLGGGNPHHAMNHGTTSPDTMPMGDMESMDMQGMGQMDLNDIDYDAYLANDRTLDDPEVVAVDKGSRVRLRIINGAASTAFTLDTGALAAELVAVDGQPVAPLPGSRFPLTMGQRIDLIVTIPNEGGSFPILASREGMPERTGVVLATAGAFIGKISPVADASGPVLDLVQERRLAAAAPLAVRPADRRFTVHLTGDMMSYQWNLMGAEDLTARSGDRVEIELMNMSAMAHPMHLHGHHFQVVGIDGERFPGALRDTVLVPPMRSVTIAFDAGKPGNWAFHCHHLYHMASGMMAFVDVAA